MNFTNFFSNINPKEVITNLPDAVFVVESDGEIIWANNKAAIAFETSVDTLKKVQFNDIVVNGLELAEKSYSKKTTVVTGAFSLNEKEFFVEMNSKKYGEQFFITIRDITTMTNVLAVAERTGRLNKEKNVMFVKLSNEIKSPLQSIMGFSQALLDGLGGNISEKQNKYVKIIKKNSAELLYFMEKFLEFAKAESSLFSIKNQSFDIINTIQNVVKHNENILNLKNLTVNYDFENFNKKAIYNDEDIMKIILQNILETSIRLTESGTITIKIDYPEIDNIEKYGIKPTKEINNFSYIQISFTDTGIGLSENELEGIFEPYTQLEKINKKTMVRSLSLGAVYLMLKRMGGAMWVNSEVMKGSTFNIILPIEKEV